MLAAPVHSRPATQLRDVLRAEPSRKRRKRPEEGLGGGEAGGQPALERIEADPLCAASFIDIVGEATANAAIHGQAHTIWFTVVEQGEQELRIEAVDDGSGVDERDGGGLGSQLLREACTEWGLTSAAGQTRL